MSEDKKNKKVKKQKEKKEKTIYVDDGRTIADMSAIGGKKDTSSLYGAPRLSRGTLKEQWETYKRAVKMMIVPMFVTIGIICLIFGALWLFLALAS